MYELMHKNDNQYLRCRDGVYYFVRRVPNDLKDIYTSDRISMRDRLRNVECPSEVIDQIGGWTRESIGEGYGVGHSLELKFKWIKKIL